MRDLSLLFRRVSATFSVLSATFPFLSTNLKRILYFLCFIHHFSRSIRYSRFSIHLKTIKATHSDSLNELLSCFNLYSKIQYFLCLLKPSAFKGSCCNNLYAKSGESMLKNSRKLRLVTCCPSSNRYSSNDRIKASRSTNHSEGKSISYSDILNAAPSRTVDITHPSPFP